MESFSVNWRAKSMDEKIAHILYSSFMTDVIIDVVDGVKTTAFKAHAVFLGMASPFLEKMVTESETIVIVDVQPDIVGYFLQFVYGRDITFSSTLQVTQLIKLADQFKVEGLKTFCVEYMQEHMHYSNVTIYLQTAYRYGLVSIREKALRIISKKTKEVLGHKNFLATELTTLGAILSLRTYNLREIHLFRAIEIWINRTVADKGKHVKGQICDFLMPKFNFLNMTSQEFLDGPAKSGLLKQKVIDQVKSKLEADKNSIYLEYLKDTNNNITSLKDVVINTCSLEPIVLATGGWKKIFFKVEEDALLTEIEIFSIEGPEEEKYLENLRFCIRKEKSHHWQSESRFNGFANHSTPIQIMLRQPLLLKAKLRYEAELYACEGRRKTVNLDGVNLFDETFAVRFDGLAKWTTQMPLHSLHFKK